MFSCYFTLGTDKNAVCSDVLDDIPEEAFLDAIFSNNIGGSACLGATIVFDAHCVSVPDRTAQGLPWFAKPTVDCLCWWGSHSIIQPLKSFNLENRYHDALYSTPLFIANIGCHINMDMAMDGRSFFLISSKVSR